MGWDGAYADDEGGEFDGGHGEKTRWFVEERRCKLVLPVFRAHASRLLRTLPFPIMQIERKTRYHSRIQG